MMFVGLPTWIVVSLLAGAAVVLAALHFLRTQPRPLRVNTTIFWAEALQASRASSLLQRFRHLLTYLLLLAICFIIILGNDTLPVFSFFAIIHLSCATFFSFQLSSSLLIYPRLTKPSIYPLIKLLTNFGLDLNFGESK